MSKCTHLSTNHVDKNQNGGAIASFWGLPPFLNAQKFGRYDVEDFKLAKFIVD
jgi:hypothetical protein